MRSELWAQRDPDGVVRLYVREHHDIGATINGSLAVDFEDRGGLQPGEKRRVKLVIDDQEQGQ